MIKTLLKGIFIIALCFSSLFLSGDYRESGNENFKETLSRNIKPEEIIYERIGGEKGAFSYNTVLDKNILLFPLSIEEYYVDENIGLFLKEDNNEKGIYLTKNINDKDEKEYKDKLILKDYIAIGSFKKIDNDVIFISQSIKNSEDIVLCRFTISTEEIDIAPINIEDKAYISDFDYLDINSIIYVKKKDSLNEICMYNIKSQKEESIVKSTTDLLNPVVSYDKNKIAYIKKEAHVYSLFLYDINSKKDIKVNINDAVIKDSIHWSYDDRYILCKTLNDGYKNMIYILDFTNNTIHNFEDIYNAIFSKDGENIIGVGYNDLEKKQYIYSINIKSKDKRVIYTFNEEGAFSQSTKIINHREL